MHTQQLLRLYRTMFLSRRIDQVEQEITNRGEAYFSLSGGGHEGTAVLADCLTPDDWLHCHYRSRALLLARGVPPRRFFDNLLCRRASASQGRDMGTFFHDPDLNLLGMVTPVGNNALQAVGVAEAVQARPHRPLVVCGMGDGSTQQGEFLEACSEARRRHLPVLFWIENNRWAISTCTDGRTFFSLPGARDLFGIPIHRVDGRNVVKAYEQLEPVIAQMRQTRAPAIVVLDVERLGSHTSADDHSIYRSGEELQQARATGDPLQSCEADLLQRGVSPESLQTLRESVIREVALAEQAALAGAEPPLELDAKKRLPVELTHPSREDRGTGENNVSMRQAIRDVLYHRLQSDPRVILFGEDIEDPKGDVFGVTRGLSSQFPGRVLNSPLSESTILGTSIGRALVGQRPVAFIQFADFLPLAQNQIASELAMLYWRTAGRWEAPVIVMAPCGGYRPGLGPYHAQTGEATLAHIPGLDVFMPCTAADAAGLLNAAFESGRPTLFLYPKALLNDMSLATARHVERQFVPIGPARKVRAGRDITYVAWGNTVRICQRVADALERVGVEAEIIDLRSLSPWDQRMVLASAEKTSRLVVVHEDNQTCGVGAEILATVAENVRVPVVCRRVARPDTHVPCHFGNQLKVLPSFRSVLTTSAELLDLELQWSDPAAADDGVAMIEAIGSGPSDDQVDIVQWFVRPGDTIKRGDPVASLEASKSIFDMNSTVEGTVEELLAPAGQRVAVGQPIARIRCQPGAAAKPAASGPLAEQSAVPQLRPKPKSGRLILPRSDDGIRQFDVGLSTIATVEGGRLVSNRDLLDPVRLRTNADVIRRTGIESRRWISPNEDAISLAVGACHQVLDQEGLILDDLELLICSTTSPTSVTPSMACRVLNQLALQKGEAMVQAFDINAACSGYLYALQAGYDFLQSRPHARVLIVTTEVLSPLLDPKDFDTAILFGDAASATVLYGEAHFDKARARLYRPELSAKSDVGGVLSVPLLHDGFIQMQGRKVFTEAVRTMIASLNRACQQSGIQIDQLDLIVPHQANQRILDAIQHRIVPRVYSNIRHHGNTSSSSIPLCLAELLPDAQGGDRFGLCAFGGGFTFGASILESN